MRFSPKTHVWQCKAQKRGSEVPQIGAYRQLLGTIFLQKDPDSVLSCLVGFTADLLHTSPRATSFNVCLNIKKRYEQIVDGQVVLMKSPWLVV